VRDRALCNLPRASGIRARVAASSTSTATSERGTVFEAVVRLSLKKLSSEIGDEIRDDDLSGPDTTIADYLERNRTAWNRWAPSSAVSGAKSWRTDELRWGLWNTPESHLQLLRAVPPGADVVELGCGTAAVCAWLQRGGMHPVGVDFSPALLAAAEQLQHEFGVYFPLISANAEAVPFDRDSFDVAVSEYGPSVWSNPRRWLPEAHRLLKLGGQLILFTNSAILMACTPADGGLAGEQLVRDYYSSYRVEFGADAGVEFHLTHGQWIRLLRANGFAIENHIELRQQPRAKPRYELVSLKWARRWPSEEIWIARKVSEEPPELFADAREAQREQTR
jgi:SAM-dependent methyltransferase